MPSRRESLDARGHPAPSRRRSSLRDQRDAVALVASAGRTFHGLRVVSLRDMVHAHRVETLLL